jgi:sterol desaturase/sphingolipid hydroxylase (fatty acid hydroxylase superfamily)
VPAKFVSNKDETIPLFTSPWLERLSHIHPATPAVVFLPIVGWFLWQALRQVPLLIVIGLAPAGLLLWTLAEYTLHRWVFHYQPTSTRGKHIHFLIHGIHHDYPRDSTRLVMPPAVSLPLAALFGLAFRSFFGASYHGVFAGFLLGYVMYDAIHYATHHWKMEGRIARFLTEYHLRHHFRDDDLGYGVSSPLWDYVFGTVRRRAI